MFSNTRPVPSKAALKVLYQLAYISSGTAVGVATLCAEERRRRTLVLQKVADNARSIRQSPRYVHNKAKKAVDEAEGQQTTPERLGKHGKAHTRRKHRLDPGDRAAHGPELPSAVDSGDAQLEQQHHSTRRRRREPGSRQMRLLLANDTTGDDVAAGRSGRDVLLAQNTSSRSCRNASAISQKVARPGVSRIAARKNAPSSARDTIVRRRVVEQPAAGPQVKAAKFQRKGRTAHFPTVAATRRLQKDDWLNLDAERLPSVQAVKQDVQLFRVYASRIEQNIAVEYEKATSVATILLRLAARKGLLTEARSMILWLASHRALSPELILVVCNSCRDLLLESKTDTASVQRFYEEFFGMSYFANQPIFFRLRARLVVLEGMVSSGGSLPTSYELTRLLALDEKLADVVLSELTRRYESICAKGSFDHAAKLLEAVLRVLARKSQPIHPYIGLIEHCLVLALSRGDLAESMRMWLRKAKIWAEEANHVQGQSFANISSQLDRIAEIADQRKAHEELASLCQVLARNLSWYQGVIGTVNLKTKASLAVACITMETVPADLYRELQAGLPAHLQNEVDGAQAVVSLKRTWENTRNLSAVFAQYECLRTAQMKSHDKQLYFDTLGPAEIALIEVCNLAEQPDRAVQIFTSGPSPGAGLRSIDSFSLAALTLASKKSWEAVESLIKTATESQLSVACDTMAARRLNSVIWMYSRQHNVTETWAFITGLVDRVAFTPNAMTVRTMLRQLVSHMSIGHPSLIPRWLKYVKSLGVHFELDSATAVAMFREYYLEHRVPHVILMELCRRLLYELPLLRSPNWNNLIKQAITYDLRKLDTQHPECLRIAGEHNLRNVEGRKHDVPVPLTSWTVSELQREHEAYAQQTSSAYHVPVQTSTDVPLVEEERRSVADHLPMPTRKGENGAGGADLQSLSQMSENANTNEYDKVIEAFYSQDRNRSVSATEFEGSEAAKRSAVSQEIDVLPSEFTDFTESIQEEHGRSEDFDEQENVGCDDDVLPNNRFMEQRRVGYSGLGSPYRTRKMMADMKMALARKKYNEVLDMYESSLGPTGLPAAPLALAIAVQARIRLDRGEIHSATAIMDAARAAGFNTSCAMAPIIIREMRMLQPEDKKQANGLRVKVIDYYRANEENGWPVSHHVGVSAANLLIDNHRPEHGIDLLDSIYTNERAKERPLDSVAMTVYLKGYLAIKSFHGVMWVVQKVLKDDIRLGRKFLHVLRHSPKAFERHPDQPSSARNSVHPWILQRLRKARAICQQRRMVQRSEAAMLGHKLIRAIALSVRKQNRGHLEWASWRTEHDEGETLVRAQPTQSRGYIARRRIARATVRAARVASWQSRSYRRRSQKRSTGAAYYQLRIRQYRVFRKARLTKADGHPISFKYYLTNRAKHEGLLKEAVIQDTPVGIAGVRFVSRAPGLSSDKQDVIARDSSTNTDKLRPPPALQHYEAWQSAKKRKGSKLVTLSPYLDIPLDIEPGERVESDQRPKRVSRGTGRWAE